jgi:hypothetical protein
MVSAGVKPAGGKHVTAHDDLVVDAIFTLSPTRLRDIAARRALSSSFGTFRKKALDRAAGHFKADYSDEQEQGKQLLEQVSHIIAREKGEGRPPNHLRLLNKDLITAYLNPASPAAPEEKHTTNTRRLPKSIFKACEQGDLHLMQKFAFPEAPIAHEASNIPPGGRLEARIRAQKAKAEHAEHQTQEARQEQQQQQRKLRWAFKRDSSGQTLLHIAARNGHGKYGRKTRQWHIAV